MPLAFTILQEAGAAFLFIYYYPLLLFFFWPDLRILNDFGGLNSLSDIILELQLVKI